MATYHSSVKNARMNATKTALGASGKLEIGTAGMAIILASHNLGAGGTVTNDTWDIVSTENIAVAGGSGDAAAARLRTSGNGDILTGLTVGLTATAAPAWAPTTVYTAGQYVTNGANQYRCTAPGTSAGSGGPTGTGSGISDGTVSWNYVSPANADVKIDNLSIVTGQNVKTSNVTIVHAA